MRRLLSAAALALAACTGAQPASSPTPRPASPTPVAVVTVSPATAAPAEPSATAAPSKAPQTLTITEFKIGAGQGPHDVAPAADGGVWYTAQRTGELGWLDPATGEYQMTKLGAGSAPHGVIVGPDGNAWVTDSGLNAIVRVDAKTKQVTRYPLPGPNVNLNTAVFDFFGVLWFTGQSGYYGSLAVPSGKVTVYPAPRGTGPYGIAATNRGSIFYASLAGSHVAYVDPKTGTSTPIDPPTAGQGARRVWGDSQGRIWVSEWNSGQLSMFSPASADPPVTGRWQQWKLPGTRPMTYAVYVDDQDIVWLTDFGANALVRFDPKTETFTSLPHSAPNAAVRQLLGRPGEVWGAMSGQDKLLLVRTR